MRVRIEANKHQVKLEFQETGTGKSVKHTFTKQEALAFIELLSVATKADTFVIDYEVR